MGVTGGDLELYQVQNDILLGCCKWISLMTRCYNSASLSVTTNATTNLCMLWWCQFSPDCGWWNSSIVQWGQAGCIMT